eukprot:11916248-Ditylum_brightwellii.AAC.1
MQKDNKIKHLSQEPGEVNAKLDELTQLFTKTCGAQKLMVDTIQKIILSKDKAQPLITESMEERILRAIATQLKINSSYCKSHGQPPND